MVNSRRHGHQEVVLIKQNDKFFSRLLTKENSSSSNNGESSLRFYYYEGSSAGSIPFNWESQPGTPKHTLNDSFAPPLTPPPSYQQQSTFSTLVKPMQQKPSRKPRFSIFPSFFPKKTNINHNDDFAPENSVYSPSVSPASSFSSATAFASTNRRHRLSRSDFRFDEYGEPVVVDVCPTSTLCFGGSSKSVHVRKMKRALLSIVGHG